MEERNRELELYKLIKGEEGDYPYVYETRWGSGSYSEELLIWVPYYLLEDFVGGIKEIFGTYPFEEGGFEGNFQVDCVCFDLVNALEGLGIDLEQIFPREEYS